jgi:hypothetical protein
MLGWVFDISGIPKGIQTPLTAVKGQGTEFDISGIVPPI